MKIIHPYRRVARPDYSWMGGIAMLLMTFPVVIVAAPPTPESSRPVVRVVADPFGPEVPQHPTVLTPVAIWPTAGPVSDEFGTLELFRGRLGLGRHTGIDIAANTGAPVVPFMPGTVTEVQRSDAGGCGRSVRLDHGDELVSVYCHLSSVAVNPGQAVSSTDVIGRVGNTGISTGPHLHFEIQKAGRPVDPRGYVAGHPG